MNDIANIPSPCSSHPHVMTMRGRIILGLLVFGCSFFGLYFLFCPSEEGVNIHDHGIFAFTVIGFIGWLICLLVKMRRLPIESDARYDTLAISQRVVAGLFLALYFFGLVVGHPLFDSSRCIFFGAILASIGLIGALVCSWPKRWPLPLYFGFFSGLIFLAAWSLYTELEPKNLFFALHSASG